MSNGRGRGKGPTVLHTLSSRPGTVWPDGLIHHGARILLLIVVAVLITALFPPVTQMSLGRYEVGDVAGEDLLATVPFSVPKTEAELERDRVAAAASVPPTFDYRPEARDTMVARLERFFAAVDSAVAAGGEEALDGYLRRVSIRPTPGQLPLLVEEASRARIRQAVLQATEQILDDGVVDNEADILTDRVAVRIADQGGGYMERSRLLTQQEFLGRAGTLLGPDASADATALVRLILIRWQEYNYQFNVVATETDRGQARDAVGATKQAVAANEAILRANQQIREADLERLEAYEAELREQGLMEEEGLAFFPFVGFTLLAVLVLGVFGVLVFLFRKEVYANFVWLLLQAGLVVAYFVGAAVIQRNGFNVELLPVAFVALSVAVMWDGRMSLVIVLCMALLTGALPGFEEYRTVLLVAVGGAAAALSVRAVRRRAQTWLFIAIITAAFAATILAWGLVRVEPAGMLVQSLFWAAAGVTASAILAMGFVPVFEWVTGITTDQTLLEWVDPNRTLLKRLSMEAPGTYAHSIQVANLCEAGAAAIGANPLLCRVGAYYHDIGKVLKPQYFVENQPEGRNPHDKLKPSTSAQIVREHVSEGLRLAREEKVPAAIADFIPEHHGTQAIAYFLQKAKDEAGGDTVDPEAFRYPGPRPQSRETAICMLADSVESATRVLKDATPERIRDLVSSLVASKIQDGQLDDTDLTMREIAALEDQFVKILASQYHHRIDYPTTRHLTDAPGRRTDAADGRSGPGGAAASGGTAGPEASAGGPPPDGARTPDDAEADGDAESADAPRLPGLG